MAYFSVEPQLGVTPAINQTLSAASVGALPGAMRPGRIIRAKDPTLGDGEFIFLPCVSGMVSGALVTYRQSASGAYTVANAPNTANLAQPLAVAMAAGVVNNYGWFQIAGAATI